MALFVEQNSNRSKLQEKLAAELNEKNKRTSSGEGDAGKGASSLPDGVDDSAYMQNTKKTTSLAGVWALIVLVGIGTMVWLVFLSANR